MKRSLATVAAAGAIAAFALAGGSAVRTRAAEPSNFLESITCSQTTHDATARFFLPSTDDARAILAERGISRAPDAIWIDLSRFDNGFRRGTFIGAGPFTGDGFAVFDWKGLVVGRTHYYRVNALVNGQWHELGRSAFGTPDCVTAISVSCLFGSDNVGVIFDLPTITHAPGRPIESWLDLSLLDNGFARNTFIAAGPFSPPAPASAPSPPLDHTVYQWDGLLPARQHYFRVNVLNDRDVWDQREFGSFLTPDCRGLVQF